MINAIPPVVPPGSKGPASGDSVLDGSANWTCYNPGAKTTEWVLRAAEDPASPSKLLNMLAENCNVEVRMAVADNQSTLLATITTLAHDESDDLRYQLAENHNIDSSVLSLLSLDSNPYVVHRAKKTLARLRGATSKVLHPLFDVWTVVPLTNTRKTI